MIGSIMEERPQFDRVVEATVEEVAEWLSFAEGREVTIHEVCRIEAQALRKLRSECARRGLSPSVLLPER